MRILFVNERCNYFGGVEQNIADTSDGLRALGHECYLAYGWTSDRGDLSRYLTYFDGCYPCAELGKDGSGESFESILKRTRPDVVYLHKFASLDPFERHFGDVRFVRVVHDHDICCPSTLKYYRFSGRTCCHKAGWRCWLDGGFLVRSHHSRWGFEYASIGRKLREMRQSYRIHDHLVDSHFMREELIQNGFPPDRVHVLPHIVRLPEVEARPVPDSPTILYVGQLIRTKGVDLLLDALSKVKCEYTATIAGTGNGEGKLREQCRRLGLDDRVKFLGWVDRVQLGAHYAAAKVVVVPSRWQEPFGMVGLEAMNYGRPVVAFAVGGIPDWLEDGRTGILVKEQDTDAYARALEEVLTDTERASRMGRAGRESVETRFCFERYVRDVESFLLGTASASCGK